MVSFNHVFFGLVSHPPGYYELPFSLPLLLLLDFSAPLEISPSRQYWIDTPEAFLLRQHVHGVAFGFFALLVRVFFFRVFVFPVPFSQTDFSLTFINLLFQTVTSPVPAQFLSTFFVVFFRFTFSLSSLTPLSLAFPRLFPGSFMGFLPQFLLILLFWVFLSRISFGC